MRLSQVIIKRLVGSSCFSRKLAKSVGKSFATDSGHYDVVLKAFWGKATEYYLIRQSLPIIYGTFITAPKTEKFILWDHTTHAKCVHGLCYCEENMHVCQDKAKLATDYSSLLGRNEAQQATRLIW